MHLLSAIGEQLNNTSHPHSSQMTTPQEKKN